MTRRPVPHQECVDDTRRGRKWPTSGMQSTPMHARRAWSRRRMEWGRSCESRPSHRPMTRQSAGMEKSPIMTRLPAQRLVQECDLDHFAVICECGNWRSRAQHRHSQDLLPSQGECPSPDEINSDQKSAATAWFPKVVATRGKVRLCTSCRKERSNGAGVGLSYRRAALGRVLE